MKERFEWIHSWCDETANSDLPRVLLAGDSITCGYQEKVRQLLKGVCYVDYIATSYAVDTKIYNDLIYKFATDSDYALIHFNHGLHGVHLTKRAYRSRIKKLIKKLGAKAEIILATSTIVYSPGNVRLDNIWTKKLKERNDVVKEIATISDYRVNDLYAVSLSIPIEQRNMDGIHYTESGYDMLATAVSVCIKRTLQER